MKILHVTKKYPNALGGDATAVPQLELNQEEMGNKVFILTSNCDEIRNKPNVQKFGLKDTPQNLDKITLKRIFSLLILFVFSFKHLRKIKPDIVNSHSPDLGFVLSFVCWLYKIPIVNTCRGVTFPYEFYHFSKRQLEKFFLKYGCFKKIITVDENSLTAFKKAGIKKVTYLPNGVNPKKFNKKKRLNKNKTVFIFVGRLENQKGVDYLLKAIKLLKSKKIKFEVHLVGEGSQKKHLKDLTKNFKLTNYVKFLGKINNRKIAHYYSSSDIFILPSLWEGFPNALLEAWASKLPVITTNVGTISKICTNKVNALIVPPKNPAKIAKAMLTLIRNKKLQKKLGINGWKLVKKSYNWKKISDELTNIYKALSKK